MLKSLFTALALAFLVAGCKDDTAQAPAATKTEQAAADEAYKQMFNRGTEKVQSLKEIEAERKRKAGDGSQK